MRIIQHLLSVSSYLVICPQNM